MISIEWCGLKAKNDTVHNFYCLMSEICCDCDSILLLVLRLVTEKNYYLNSCDNKMTLFS